MGFFSRFIDTLKTSAEKAASRVAPAVSALGFGDLMAMWKNSNKLSAAKAIEYSTGWVYACIRAIGEEIANAELKLYRVKNGKREEVADHELIDLLYSANGYQTGYELRYLMASHLELIGNTYLYLEGVKSENEKPKSIHILDPRHVKVIRSKGFPPTIHSYEYKKPDLEKQIFQPYEILHLKYPDSLDAFEGIGTVQSIAQWVDADNFATEFNRRFFINGARLSGFLETENNYTKEQVELLRTQFQEIYSGLANAYKVAALPKGTKFNPGSESQKDMDFVNLQLMMRDKILAGFRVPRTVLGITDDVNRANAEATNYIFALRTIKPKLRLIESYLNEFLVPRYGKDIYLEFEDIVPENRELTIKEMQASVSSQPVISVNEARERYFGLPGIENGDAVMGDFTRVPVGTPKPQAPTKAAPQKLRIKKLPSVKAKDDLVDGIFQKAAEQLTKLAETTKEKTIVAINISTLTDEEYGGIYKSFLTRVTNYEDKQVGIIRKVNKTIKSQVLENIGTAVKAFDPSVLYNAKEAVALLVKLTIQNYTDLYKKEGAEAAALVGFADFDPLTPEIQKALEAAITLMAESYDETTRKLLKQKIEEGIEQGASLDQMTDLVNGVFEYSDEVRARTVSRTETFRVANEANRAAWRESGVVESLKWYTAEDERVCPYCGPMHDKLIDIEENFFDKGDQIVGSDGNFMLADYSDIAAPPLHPNCRCYIRPENITIE